MSAPFSGALTRPASSGTASSTRPAQLSQQQLPALPPPSRHRQSSSPLQLSRPTAVLQAEAPTHRREKPDNPWPTHSQNGAAKESDFTTGQLLHGRTAFQEEHKIRSYECGPDQATTVFTISNLLQVRAPLSAYSALPRSCVGKWVRRAIGILQVERKALQFCLMPLFFGARVGF